MNLGAEPKKTAILGVLVAAGGYLFYSNVISGPDTPSPSPRAAAPGAAQPLAQENNAGKANTFRKKSGRSSQEFHPTLKFRPEDRPNYATIDPTLRLDLLAKVHAIEPEGGSRSLFQVLAAPPPTPEETKKLAAVIHPTKRPFGPQPPSPPAVKPPPPPDPPPPPITLKFFGYSAPRPGGARRAFFLDGDDIFVASEGELVKKRYRVVQIGVNSVIMEDTQYKNNRQTLIIQPEQAG